MPPVATLPRAIVAQMGREVVGSASGVLVYPSPWFAVDNKDDLFVFDETIKEQHVTERDNAIRQLHGFDLAGNVGCVH